MGGATGSLPAREQVVLRLRPHAGVLVRPLLVLLGTLAAAGFAAASVPFGEWQPAGRWVVAAVAALVVARWSLLPWLRWASTVLVVSDLRVGVERGLLRRTARNVPLSRVADVATEQTLRERLVGSGTLVVVPSGHATVLVVRRVPRLRDVAAAVSDLVQQAPPEPEPQED